MPYISRMEFLVLERSFTLESLSLWTEQQQLTPSLGHSGGACVCVCVCVCV